MPAYVIALICIASFIGFVLLVLLAGGIYIFNKVFKRKQQPILGSLGGASEQKKNIVVPMRKEALEKLDSYTYEPMNIKADDGLKLVGRLYRTSSANPKGLLVCAHGYNSNPLRVYAYITPYLLEDGWDCLLINLRAHADSEGKYSGFSILEQEDVRCWLTHVVDKYKKIFLYGHSMGAATMGLAASRPLPINVKGVIFDCGFSNAKDVIYRVLPKKLMTFIKPMFWIADLIARIVCGFSYLSKNNELRNNIQKTQLPFLFIHGTKDEVVPIEHGYELDKLCPTEHTFNVFEGAEHMASIYLEPERYIKLVKEFINKY